MTIDTLLLSGGGIKCLTFIGSLKYILDKKKIEIKKLKTIISVSGGMIYITPLLLGYSIDEIIKIALQTNNKELLDYDDININSFINKYGLFTNNYLVSFFETLLDYKEINKQINLQDFYDITNII